MTPAVHGLDMLATAVLIANDQQQVVYLNASAENLFAISLTQVAGRTLSEVFGDAPILSAAIRYATAHNCSYTEHELELAMYGRPVLQLACTVTVIDHGLLLELRQIDQQLRVEREARLFEQSQAHRELIRNLAHEIKNPLGGIRGAAQLLERELERPALHEYTQVIIKETDRLQTLMDRLLSPHRMPTTGPVNIHEVLERVRSVMVAEFPNIRVRRDYDISMPLLTGDREQLIQVVLNIARNAAQALSGAVDIARPGEIYFKTRIVRQVTIARSRYRHAICLEIIDNGPGIPEAMRERVFQPLISGRVGGSGLGLTIAHNFVLQHHGTITVASAPGRTCFTVLLPVLE
jgi:two-component system nitrogen regulation sensor histidine kinase GlnL